MSRGIGKKQKELIEMGGATELLFDCIHSLTVYSGSRTPVPDFQPGEGRDGIERWYGTQIVTTAEYLKQLIDERDFVRADSSNEWTGVELERLSKATISADDLHCQLDPQLFQQDHRTEKWNRDAGMYGKTEIRTDDAVKKGRNKVRVTVSRAFSSLEERGLVMAASLWRSFKPHLNIYKGNKKALQTKRIFESRGWQAKDTGVGDGMGEGRFYFAIDPAALASNAVKQPA